jgi:hypothetical protein
MDPEKIESANSPAPQHAAPGPVENPNRDVLASLPIGDLMHNPKVTGYLGKATKVVALCAISGCILLVIAIFAVVNTLSQITNAIHP